MHADKTRAKKSELKDLEGFKNSVERREPKTSKTQAEP